MSDLKYCQGTKCHQQQTKDRIKGIGENKTYQTRRRSRFYYGNGNFCSVNCQADWFDDFGNKAIDHFGRLTEPKHLTRDNAWSKNIDWGSHYDNRQYFYRNGITNEQRPITEQQFRDDNYNLNTD